MSSSNDGKYLEDNFENVVTDLNRIDIAVDRLPDTRAARNIIKAQNADFLVSTAATGAFYFECKSVGGIKTILRSFRQYPLMHRWAQAGIPGYVLIHYHELNEFWIVDVSNLPKMTGKQYKLTPDYAVWRAAGKSEEDFSRIILAWFRSMGVNVA